MTHLKGAGGRGEGFLVDHFTPAPSSTARSAPPRRPGPHTAPTAHARPGHRTRVVCTCRARNENQKRGTMGARTHAVAAVSTVPTVLLRGTRACIPTRSGGGLEISSGLGVPLAAALRLPLPDVSESISFSISLTLSTSSSSCVWWSSLGGSDDTCRVRSIAASMAVRSSRMASRSLRNSKAACLCNATRSLAIIATSSEQYSSCGALAACSSDAVDTFARLCSNALLCS